MITVLRFAEEKVALGFFVSSFTTIKFIYPRPAAHAAIFPISNPFPFFLLTNSAPGTTFTNSSQNSYEIRVARAEVVIKTFGGIVGSAASK